MLQPVAAEGRGGVWARQAGWRGEEELVENTLINTASRGTLNGHKYNYNKSCYKKMFIFEETYRDLVPIH